MNKVISLLAAGIMSVTIAGAAQATLLTNGGFDDESIGLGGTSWSVYQTIPGWITGSGAGIEVQRGTVVTADSLSQYVELDSHGANSNSGMFQSVFLNAGLYELDWKYYARTNNSGDDNGIKAYVTDVNDNKILDIDAISKKRSDQQTTWEDVSWSFTITSSDTYKLWFAAFGRENTLGGFIDSVSLTPVPEPATMLLFGAGLAGLATIRRRK